MRSNGVNASGNGPTEGGHSGAEDFIEAEIEAGHMDSPAAEVEMRDALQKLPGIVKLDLSKGKISIRYDPTLTSETRIADAAASAGHSVEKVAISRGPGHADSPPPAGSE